MDGLLRPLSALPVAALAGLVLACGVDPEPTGTAPPPPAEAADLPDTIDEIRLRPKASSRIGSALARSPSEPVLYLADEDHAALRRIPLTPDADGVMAIDAAAITSIDLPGKPAQVIALADQVLVTIRDPGLLLMMKPGEAGALKEAGRVSLPDDAWGLAISPDERTVLVSSAWTHKVSGVDIDRAAVLFTVDVPREPRAIAIQNDGASAYVTHLVGAPITKITGLDSDAPKVSSIALPADPLRTAYGDVTSASLGYSAVFSPDGGLLYVARHALGALGPEAWFGTTTVDVLATKTDKPVAPRRQGGSTDFPITSMNFFSSGGSRLYDDAGNLPAAPPSPFPQPRAMVYRASMNTLLIASEGNDTLVEVDALSVAPALQRLHTYSLADEHEKDIPVAAKCGAPSALALSPDELTAFVFCRSTSDLAEVDLHSFGDRGPRKIRPNRSTRVATDPLGNEAALGRRLFYNASDSMTSGGLGCAGCHPEGRDDGFVWHELKRSPTESRAIFVGSGSVLEVPEKDAELLPEGFARQTPMLAGRVSAQGPYGWHAESKDLEERLQAGFDLHRWSSGWGDKAGLSKRARVLASFLREGLVPPPRQERALTPQEERGKALFLAESTQCSACHGPSTEYTDRTATPLGAFPTPRGYDEDPNPAFKVPSLLFVGGTAPYYHDGSAASLEDLIRSNNNRMGKTNHLTREDRAALVAFLKTL